MASPAQARLTEVTNEVRVLQSLIERLAGREDSVAAQPVQTIAAAAGGGRARVTVARNLTGAQIIDLVREGLCANRIDLYLQPMVGLPQRKRRGYECFSRIRTGDGMVIVPEQYIALAEDEGLITAIDNMLLFRCVQLVRKV